MNDFSREGIEDIFDIADSISEGKSAISLKENAVLALLFEKPSTRTRIAFEVAMAKLGGRSIYIDAKSSRMSSGESAADTARSLSLYVDFIAARMHNHSSLVELAENSTVPVINALTDLEHPTQAIADLYTIATKKRKVRGMRIAFVGDITQGTCNSLMAAGTKLGAEIALVGPKEYPPNPQYLTRSREYGIVDIYDSMQEGLMGADVVYTDNFANTGYDKDGGERRKLFLKYQVNDKAIQYAKKDVFFMHPLPAFRGEEVTADVLEGPKSVVWEQSRNKMLLAQAIILYLSEKGIR